MLGNLLLLFLSWSILKLTGNNLKVLGLFPDPGRTFQFVSGFLVTATLAAIYFFGIIGFLQAEVIFNNSYTFWAFLRGSWEIIKSVLYEELIFRGALLYFMLKYLGDQKGLFLSAVIFGIYHWFTYDVFGDLTQMIFTLLITGVGGWIFGFAYLKTRSLFLPIGLHLGWNFVTIVIFSQGILMEDQLLLISTEAEMGFFGSILSVLYQTVLFPAISILFTRFLARRYTSGSTLNNIVEA